MPKLIKIKSLPKIHELKQLRHATQCPQAQNRGTVALKNTSVRQNSYEKILADQIKKLSNDNDRMWKLLTESKESEHSECQKIQKRLKQNLDLAQKQLVMMKDMYQVQRSNHELSKTFYQKRESQWQYIVSQLKKVIDDYQQTRCFDQHKASSLFDQSTQMKNQDKEKHFIQFPQSSKQQNTCQDEYCLRNSKPTKLDKRSTIQNQQQQPQPQRQPQQQQRYQYMQCQYQPTMKSIQVTKVDSYYMNNNPNQNKQKIKINDDDNQNSVIRSKQLQHSSNSNNHRHHHHDHDRKQKRDSNTSLNSQKYYVNEKQSRNNNINSKNKSSFPFQSSQSINRFSSLYYYVNKNSYGQQNKNKIGTQGSKSFNETNIEQKISLQDMFERSLRKTYAQYRHDGRKLTDILENQHMLKLKAANTSTKERLSKTIRKVMFYQSQQDFNDLIKFIEDTMNKKYRSFKGEHIYYFIKDKLIECENIFKSSDSALDRLDNEPSGFINGVQINSKFQQFQKRKKETRQQQEKHKSPTEKLSRSSSQSTPINILKSNCEQCIKDSINNNDSYLDQSIVNSSKSTSMLNINSNIKSRDQNQYSYNSKDNNIKLNMRTQQLPITSNSKIKKSQRQRQRQKTQHNITYDYENINNYKNKDDDDINDQQIRKRYQWESSQILQQQRKNSSSQYSNGADHYYRSNVTTPKPKVNIFTERRNSRRKLLQNHLNKKRSNQVSESSEVQSGLKAVSIQPQMQEGSLSSLIGVSQQYDLTTTLIPNNNSQSISKYLKTNDNSLR